MIDKDSESELVADLKVSPNVTFRAKIERPSNLVQIHEFPLPYTRVRNTIFRQVILYTVTVVQKAERSATFVAPGSILLRV